MKLFLLIALLACISYAVKPTNGKEILDVLKGLKHDGEVVIIYFYDPQCCAPPKEFINDIERAELDEKVLNVGNGKNYITYDVDASEIDMKPVADLLQVDVYQVKHGPTIAISCEGTAYWAHGEGASAKIAKKTGQFDTLSEDSLEKVAKKEGKRS